MSDSLSSLNRAQMHCTQALFSVRWCSPYLHAQACQIPYLRHHFHLAPCGANQRYYGTQAVEDPVTGSFLNIPCIRKQAFHISPTPTVLSSSNNTAAGSGILAVCSWKSTLRSCKIHTKKHPKTPEMHTLADICLWQADLFDEGSL